MDWSTLLTLVLGLVLLTAGADVFVRGATRFAARMGISPLVIGLTVVAFGTSAPELAVSLQAGLAGNSNIAVANVVGSNIFNVLFILGACALLAPLIVEQQLVRKDVPLMLGLSLLVWWMAADGAVGATEGLILTLGIAAYTTWLIIASRKETQAVQQEYVREFGTDSKRQQRQGLGMQLLMMAGGLTLLVLGARWMVGAAVQIAYTLGVSDAVIGLTIVAAGTSLPEVATSIVATLRGERDIAVGNVVGSNLFNLMGILGLSALLTPGGLLVDAALAHRDMLVMVASALLCVPIFFTGMRIARWEGAVFLGGYLVYTTYLIMEASGHPSAALVEAVVLLGLAPPIALAVVVSALREMRHRRRR